MVFRSQFKDLLQTFLIFLVFLLHVALGTALCQGAFFTNQWLLLPGRWHGTGVGRGEGVLRSKARLDTRTN